MLFMLIEPRYGSGGQSRCIFAVNSYKCWPGGKDSGFAVDYQEDKGIDCPRLLVSGHMIRYMLEILRVKLTFEVYVTHLMGVAKRKLGSLQILLNSG